jgi:mannosyl-3-phosphoglycerate phosphatase family protein
MSTRPLVFTDLDGSLLDHNSYSFEPARAMLDRLEALSIPVIPNTSKTRAELFSLRRALGNRHPFIVENGAAVFIPVGYFPERPARTVERDGFWVHQASRPRAEWLALLAQLEADFGEEYDSFHRAGVKGIVEMTGLGEDAARLANQREYSEPVRWLGSEDRRQAFIRALAAHGAKALQGGRFLAVSGDCDKGRALQWLSRVFADQAGVDRVDTLAIGDSGNDVAMLAAADTALLIRSPAHDFPALERGEGVIRSAAFGPEGWAEGVARWLQHR